MAKDLLYNPDIQQGILNGVNKLADAIKVTLGPKGRYVAVGKSATLPLVTNDGVSIAKEIELPDPFEAMGAALIKEVAEKTNDVSGDGTTTATLLTRYMVKKGFTLVAAGANPVALKKGILQASQLAAAAIKKLAKPVDGEETIRQVASISANDDAIGELIAQAISQAGSDGVVTIEESNTWETQLKIAEGMQFERGYLSPEMAKDKERMVAELEQPYILVTDREISDPQEILPLLNSIMEKNRPLLIIAEGVKGAALGTLIINSQEGLIEAVAVHPPAYGEGRRARMDDIALWTGATFFTSEMGLSLSEATLDMLGSAESVKVDARTTVIIGGSGNKQAINERIAGLRTLIAQTDYEFNRKQLEERLARLNSGVAVISVGGTTESEMQERKLRFEDALNAARAAMTEGIVPGGGAAYLDIKPAIEAYCDTLAGDEREGAEMVLDAMDQITRQIAENAGLSGAVVVEKLAEAPAGTGFNAATMQYVDMISEGIIDAAKVARTALLNAASVSAILLTTEAGVVQQKEKSESE